MKTELCDISQLHFVHFVVPTNDSWFLVLSKEGSQKILQSVTVSMGLGAEKGKVVLIHGGNDLTSFYSFSMFEI